jgi:hypothetical protein
LNCGDEVAGGGVVGDSCGWVGGVAGLGCGVFVFFFFFFFFFFVVSGGVGGGGGS